ncbi:MAG: cupin domain-containing protein [Gammaproteobacteria bacterium]|nr:cupin domain-containing protein [Gammaproteobacteria bacterium]MDH4314319.1 cupin domain-containing protein [Gammaproteobacteria bacterium]MDH5215445.1 cupin domain-containing protein [Gammaproteobacteria bacterium]MDH5501290.1 cupin domain-containing protein [Gammaproteobacteria bacterium]
MASRNIDDLIFFDRHAAEFSEVKTDIEKCLRGQPLQKTWHHFTSDDEKFFAGIWEAQPGCWKISYTENEFCQILEGRSVLRDAAGNECPLKAGDNFTIPAGFVGEWDVLETTRKIYVIYQP